MRQISLLIRCTMYTATYFRSAMAIYFNKYFPCCTAQQLQTLLNIHSFRKFNNKFRTQCTILYIYF